MLERLGWRSIEARDGLEAWEMLESADPDLLIVDLDVPVLDATQVIRAAKAQGSMHPERNAVLLQLRANTGAIRTTLLGAEGNEWLFQPPLLSSRRRQRYRHAG